MRVERRSKEGETDGERRSSVKDEGVESNERRNTMYTKDLKTQKMQEEEEEEEEDADREREKERENSCSARRQACFAHGSRKSATPGVARSKTGS